MSWRAPDRRRNRVKSGVGKAWISLDSLVRIETYQWVTSDFLLKFFDGRFLVIRAACAAPVGRFAPLSTPPAPADGTILSK